MKRPDENTLKIGGAISLIAIGFLSVTYVLSQFSANQFLTALLQSATILGGIGSALTILDFTGSSNESEEPREFHVNHQHAVKEMASSEPSENFDWTSASAEEKVDRLQNHPDWSNYGDQEYENRRTTANRFSNLYDQLTQLPYLTAKRVNRMLFTVLALACILVIIQGAHVLSPVTDHPIVGTIRNTPIPYSPYLFASALLLLFAPVYYLNSKSMTACKRCDTPAAARSLGRFYHIQDGKTERGPTNDSRNEGTYMEFEGIRVTECVDCGEYTFESIRWDDKEDQQNRL